MYHVMKINNAVITSNTANNQPRLTLQTPMGTSETARTRRSGCGRRTWRAVRRWMPSGLYRSPRWWWGRWWARTTPSTRRTRTTPSLPSSRWASGAFWVKILSQVCETCQKLHWVVRAGSFWKLLAWLKICLSLPYRYSMGWSKATGHLGLATLKSW